MKRIKVPASLILIMLIALFFTACPSAPEVYQVTFDSQGATTGANPTTKEVVGTSGTDTIDELPSPPEKTGDTFGGWYTAAGGDGEPFTTSTPVTGNITVYAKWIPLYAVGDSGPAGGVVFHDKGNYTSGWRYLEAAPSDIDMGEDEFFPYYHIFGYYRTETDGASTVVGTATGIGTGETNTAALVSAMGETAYKSATNTDDATTASYAVRLSYLHEAGGYDDWFLPSKDELNLMYQNLHDRETPLGGFSDGFYWSSSEDGASYVWIQYFANGMQSNFGSRDSRYNVRPVRAF
jgi:uncharacterized repeat protein (TIGR02543 family)